jgi:hypothetical protein
VQAQLHPRMRGTEVAHRRRQRIARLRVGGGDGQRAAVLGREIFAGAPQVVGLQQQPLDDRQHRLAGRRQPGQALAGTLEQRDAELVLQLADLPADARLRGVQRLGHGSEVEALAHGLAHGAQLLEVHGARLA